MIWVRRTKYAQAHTAKPRSNGRSIFVFVLSWHVSPLSPLCVGWRKLPLLAFSAVSARHTCMMIDKDNPLCKRQYVWKLNRFKTHVFLWGSLASKDPCSLHVFLALFLHNPVWEKENLVSYEQHLQELMPIWFVNVRPNTNFLRHENARLSYPHYLDYIIWITSSLFRPEWNPNPFFAFHQPVTIFGLGRSVRSCNQTATQRDGRQITTWYAHVALIILSLRLPCRLLLCCPFGILSCSAKKMDLHALFIILLFTILCSNVHCLSRSFGSNKDRERRDDWLFDTFASENEDDARLFANSDEFLFKDEPTIESLNDLDSFTANPSEEIAQGSSCERPLGKRDVFENDLILSIPQYSFLNFE